jgi:hypothetical protein
MPEWIHSRAEHLLAKNPDMKKETAFAVATQQSHALGKSPKSYGTKRGRQEAKAKYDTPKDDVKKANPGGLDSPKLATIQMAAMRDELLKIAEAGLEKDSGPVWEATKRVLTAPIPGTKTWLVGRGAEAAEQARAARGALRGASRSYALNPGYAAREAVGLRRPTMQRAVQASRQAAQRRGDLLAAGIGGL